MNAPGFWANPERPEGVNQDGNGRRRELEGDGIGVNAISETNLAFQSQIQIWKHM